MIDHPLEPTLPGFEGIDRIVRPGTLAIDDAAEEQFWSKVVKGPRCWIWVGAISSPDGYGRFSWQRGGVRRTLSAHRFALTIAGFGGDLAGSVGEHECCEPLCVRCDAGHLRVATQSENIAFAVRSGRHVGSATGAGSSGRVERSRRVRDAVRDGWDERAYRLAVDPLSKFQLNLIPEP